MVQRLLSKLLERQSKLMGQLRETGPEARAARGASGSALARRQTPGEPTESEKHAVEAAMTLLEQGAVDRAQASLQPFEDNGQWSTTFVLLGRIALRMGDADRALLYASRAEVQDSLDPGVARLMADTHGQLGNQSEEIRYRRMRVFVQGEPKASDLVDLARAVVTAATPGSTRAVAKEMRVVWAHLDRTADVGDQHRVAFAEHAFRLRETDREARETYVRTNPPHAGEFDVSANWVRMVSYANDRGLPIQRGVDAGIPSRRPSLAELAEVYVDPAFDWIPIVEGGKVVLADSVGRRPRLRSTSPSSPLLLSSDSKAYLRLREDTVRIKEPALLVGGSRDAYAHAVEHLGVLAVAERFGIDTSIKLAVSAGLLESQLAVFIALGYGRDRIIPIPADRPVIFDRAWVASKPTYERTWVDPLVPDWFRRRLGRDKSAIDSPTRIHLACEGEHEGEVADVLTQESFSRVDPARTPLGELVGRLHAARWIVGHEPGDLAPMLYAPAGADVLFVTADGHPSKASEAARALSVACGHRFGLLAERSLDKLGLLLEGA